MTTTYIYTKYEHLYASKLAQEEFIKAKEVFELACRAIEAKLRKAEEEFEAKRTLHRKNAKFSYYMTNPTINEFGKHYHIHRKIENPLEGDTEFNKEIHYNSFKIVNNVYIATGGGHMLPLKNGDLLTNQEVEELNNLVVPETFKK